MCILMEEDGIHNLVVYGTIVQPTKPTRFISGILGVGFEMYCSKVVSQLVEM